MDMDIRLLVETFRQSEPSGPGADIRERCLCRLLHHISEFPGQGHFPRSLHDGGLNRRESPAYLGPGKTDRETDFIPPLCFPMTEFRHTQIARNRFRGNLYSAFSTLRHNLLGYLTADGSDFPLQIPYPRFPRILTDDRQQRTVRKKNTVFFKPVGHNHL